MGLAGLYEEFIDLLVIDNLDIKDMKEIGAFGMDAMPLDIMMSTFDDKIQLARAVLDTCKDDKEENSKKF